MIKIAKNLETLALRRIKVAQDAGGKEPVPFVHPYLKIPEVKPGPPKVPISREDLETVARIAPYSTGIAGGLVGGVGGAGIGALIQLLRGQSVLKGIGYGGLAGLGLGGTYGAMRGLRWRDPKFLAEHFEVR